MSQPLEITIKSQLANVIDQFRQVTREVRTFDKAIETTITKLDNNGFAIGATQIRKSLDGAVTETYKIDENGKLISTTIKSIKNDSGKLKTILSTAFDINRLYLYWNLTKRIRDGMINMLKASIDYTETQNKFNVSMGDGRENAIKFVNQMTEAVGLAKTELMNYQATYKNILSGLGNFTHKESEKISESLVKMALDYSSLFNVDTGESMEKFQSALVGSIRPIRSDSGYDVSDTTIGAKAQELGLDRTVGQLNQMEKRILRIIVLMDQLKNTGAFGDLARTIEQPANQIRVLKAQVQELGVWIGNVFMGTIGKILPYVNAFVMVLKELIKMFALFVGYKGDNTSLSDIFESAEDSTGGVSNNIGDANKKAKELRKTLMGFDVLNVINTPKDSDSSGGAGGVGGIDPAILDALGEYDSLMEHVRMKATDIRDRIMDWLGFTKEINPLTGEVSWELREGYTNIEKIRDVIIGLISIGLFVKLVKFISTLKKLKDIFMGVEIGKSALFIGLTSLKTAVSGLGLTGLSATVATVSATIGGMLVSIAGIFTIIKGAIDLFQGNTFDGIMEVLAGIAFTVSGIALLFGAWPVAIAGAVVGAVALITMAIVDNWNSVKTFFSNIWTTFNEKVVSPITTFVSGIATTVWNTAIQPIINFFTPIFEAIMNIYSTIIKNITDIVANITTNVILIISKIVEIWNKIVEIYVALENAFKTYIINPIFSFIENVAGWVYDHIISPVINYFKQLWDKVYNGFILPLKNKLQWVHDTIWNLFGSIGQRIVDFIGGIIKGAINGVFERIESNINGFIRLLNGATNIINKIPGVNISQVSELILPRMAEGGLPPIGQMFIARESGPELVGKIGNTTTVMNNQQIVQAVSQGVAQAVAQVMGSGERTTVVELDSREIARAVEKRMTRNQNVYGTT